MTGVLSQQLQSRTELFILYAAAITHPYMRTIRAPGTENVNILDLGPLHDEV